MSLSPTVSPPMQRKAEALAELLPTFSRGRSKQTDQAFYVVPASNRRTAHWTALDGSGCTCLGYQRRGTCTHAIAARTVHERQCVTLSTPECATFFGPDSASNVTLSEPENVAHLAPKARATYADLFPCCAVDGCDNDPEPREQFCHRHVTVCAF